MLLPMSLLLQLLLLRLLVLIAFIIQLIESQTEVMVFRAMHLKEIIQTNYVQLKSRISRMWVYSKMCSKSWIIRLPDC